MTGPHPKLTTLRHGIPARALILAAGIAGVSLANRVWAVAPNTAPVISSQSWNELYATTNPTRGFLDSIEYSVDNAPSLASVPFDRVRYRMEAKVGDTLRFASVTFDGWSGLTVENLRFPDHQDPVDQPDPDFWFNTRSSVPPLQRNVSNLFIESNAGIATGRVPLGRLEIWPGDYLPAPSDPQTTGGDARFDWDDTLVAGRGYGSFQVHNLGAGETVFAWKDRKSVV